MPRIIVIPETGQRPVEKYLDEEVRGVHLNDEHSAVQFLERLAWAIADAERAEGHTGNGRELAGMTR